MANAAILGGVSWHKSNVSVIDHTMSGGPNNLLFGLLTNHMLTARTHKTLNHSSLFSDIALRFQIMISRKILKSSGKRTQPCNTPIMPLLKSQPCKLQGCDISTSITSCNISTNVTNHSDNSRTDRTESTLNIIISVLTSIISMYNWHQVWIANTIVQLHLNYHVATCWQLEHNKNDII